MNIADHASSPLSSSIDSLLQDLDGLTTISDEPVTVRFVPHPPERKAPSLLVNPKIKFAVEPTIVHAQTDTGGRICSMTTNTSSTKAEELDMLLSLLSSPRSQMEVDETATAVQPFSPASGSDSSRIMSPSLQQFVAPTSTSSKSDFTFDFETENESSRVALSELSSSALNLSPPKGLVIDYDVTKVYSFDESDSDMETELDCAEDTMRKPASKSTLANPLPELTKSSSGSSSPHNSSKAPSFDKNDHDSERDMEKMYKPAFTNSLPEISISSMSISVTSSSQALLLSPPPQSKSPVSLEKKTLVVDEASSSSGTVVYNYKSNSMGKLESSFDKALNLSIEEEVVTFGISDFRTYTSEIPKISGGSSGAAKSRCSRVVLAGSAMERGLKASLFSKCACDNLRCINCNFQVRCFRGTKWKSEVDYMFFRNNAMSDEKLSSALYFSAESFAYCCQCSWINVQNEVTLTAGGSSNSTSCGSLPQWICAGHSS